MMTMMTTTARACDGEPPKAPRHGRGMATPDALCSCLKARARAAAIEATELAMFLRSHRAEGRENHVRKPVADSSADSPPIQQDDGRAMPRTTAYACCIKATFLKTEMLCHNSQFNNSHVNKHFFKSKYFF